MDKLLARLQHSEVLQVIYSLAWTYEDYVRGYKYKEGLVTLNSWILPSYDEEKVILRHFTKFPDTRDVATKFIQALETGKKPQVNTEETRSVYQSKLRGIIAAMPSVTGSPAASTHSPMLFQAMSGGESKLQSFSPRAPPGLIHSVNLPTKTQIVNPVPKITPPISEYSKIRSHAPITINQNEEIIEPSTISHWSTTSRPSSNLNTSNSSSSSSPKISPRPRTTQNSGASGTNLLTCQTCKRTFRSPLMFKLHKNLHTKEANSSVAALKRKPGAILKKSSNCDQEFTVSFRDKTDDAIEKTDASLLEVVRAVSGANLSALLAKQNDGKSSASVNEIESLQTLVAHLDKSASGDGTNVSRISPKTRRIQIKPLNVSSLPSSSSSDVTSYPPNASLEMGPGGTMVPTLKSASKHTPPSTYTVNSTASSASSPSASCGQQNSPGSISSAHTTTAVTTASSTVATRGESASPSPSSSSSSSQEQHKSGGGGGGGGNPSLEFDLEVPVFGETVEGLICGVCHKTYKNKTCLKQHFNNVHLRLQHSCWIKGCNSSFPSKRSRDRHSLNYNLHSHLLQSDDVTPNTPTTAANAASSTSDDVIDFSNTTGQSESSSMNTITNSPDSSTESVATSKLSESAEVSSVLEENCQPDIKMESEIPDNFRIDEMSAFMENNQSVVVWPKPAPVHGEMDF
ncbi:uncharacterized protein LOC142358291 [Convolutriloba macropyga]|uniref:uncharacterized protein LOC142358291 n=1 Tax=Convolutriloba macropyga TaxID=536237 RepID=UPI003F51B527